MDWSEHFCSLIRETEGKRPTLLVVKMVPGSRETELWLLDARWPKSGPPPPGSQIEITLLPSGYSAKQPVFGVSVAGRRGVGASRLENDFVRTLASSEKVVITHKKKELASIPTPNAAKAVKSTRDCEAEVLRSWGFDPAVMQSLRSPPVPATSPGSWLSDSDYPQLAIRTNASGPALVRMTVAADGKLESCSLLQSSGSPLLDNKSCQVMLRRARFTPAVAADGHPTRGIAALRIWWILP